jgi:FkbM family methyltransferase
MCVYDLGANKGQMALVFCSLVGGRGQVFAFEPASQEYGALLGNLALNGIQNCLTFMAAVADRDGEMQFEYAPHLPTQGKLLEFEPTSRHVVSDKVTVRTVSLDSVVASGARPPDLIKIDTEGAAAAVFRGARKVLDQYSPGIYIELHGPEEQQGVRDELLARGYKAETLDGRRVEDPTTDWNGVLWCYR